MRKFQVTVNGNTYEVEVEELQGEQTVAPVAAPTAAAPAAVPAAPKAAPKKAAAPAAAGSIKVTAPMPGTILDIKVNVGDSVKEGDVIAILEAMKMENEVVATGDGKVASINVSKGASVNTGDLIATIG